MKQDTAAKMMVIASCIWFGLALTMGLLTALKFIVPTVGEIEYLSLPRVRMLHTNINLFGWLLQANMGILFWILPRILHTKLFSEKLGVVMGVLYNLTLIGGLTCIMLGIVKNVEYGEIPAPFDYLVAVCWVVLANLRLIGTAVETASFTASMINEKVKMQRCCRILKLYYMDRNELPSQPWVVIHEAYGAEGRSTEGLNQDQWGTPYRLVYTRSGFAMLCAGSDQEFGSDDDIRFDEALGRLGYQYPGGANPPQPGAAPAPQQEW